MRDQDSHVYALCHGPALKPMAEECKSKNNLGHGWHRVPDGKDVAAYNGIRNWRCPECFTEHRRRVRAAK